MSSRRSLVLAVASAWAIAACADTFGLYASSRDSDGDGVADRDDNCPLDPNPGQEDRDGMAPGDACDVCPTDKLEGRDLDHDGRDDGCDGCVGDGFIGVDSDNDGIDDGCDPCVNDVPMFDDDIDADGRPDACETCVGRIGVDLDGDGEDDACDLCPAGPNVDEDGDGIFDACDNCPATPNPDNASSAMDTDALGNACDPDVMTAHGRTLFDGFHVRPSDWKTNDPVLWTLADHDGLSGTTDSIVGPSVGQRTELLSPLVITNEEFRVLTQVRGVATGSGGVWITSDDLKITVRCAIESGLLIGTIEGNGSDPPMMKPTGDLDPAMYDLELTVTRGANPGEQAFSCSLVQRASPIDAVAKTGVLSFPIKTWSPGLFVEGTMTFEWIEVIETINTFQPL